MRSRGSAALVAAMVAGVIFGAPALAAAAGDGLEPGGLTDFDERVTVNVWTGAAKADVKARVREPSTWTVVGAPRSRMEPSTIDLEPVANRKRLGR